MPRPPAHQPSRKRPPQKRRQPSRVLTMLAVLLVFAALWLIDTGALVQLAWTEMTQAHRWIATLHWR
jgi:hypothetical protein